MTRPQPTEAADYISKYIDLVTSDDIVPAMENQMGEMLEFLSGISEDQSLHSYAPGKWTIRQVLNHVNDGERVFSGRVFWFARGFTDALPISTRKSPSRWLMRTTLHGLIWWTSSKSCDLGRSRYSKLCRQRHGSGRVQR